MPPPASHRLAIVLVPPPGADLWAGLSAWESAGFVVADPRSWGEGMRVGLPGPRPLVAGGFASVRAVRFDRERLVANRQGGFRVFCPVDGRGVVPAFNHAMSGWRSGGPREMGCPCGATHDLGALVYRPDAAFAHAVIEVLDAEDASLVPGALAAIEAAWRGVPRVVLRRG